MFIKFFNKNIENTARQTIEKTFSNILKKIASKNVKNCMSYHADRAGKSSFEKNAFKLSCAFRSRSRAIKQEFKMNFLIYFVNLRLISHSSFILYAFLISKQLLLLIFFQSTRCSGLFCCFHSLDSCVFSRRAV